MSNKPSSPSTQVFQKTSTTSSLRSLNPLSNKVASVLSTAYADSDFRDALGLLDERAVVNSAETRRQLRLDLQKEIIARNGEIILEFGRVADVSLVDQYPPLLSDVADYEACNSGELGSSWKD